MDNILGKTAREAINYIVSEYNQNSGKITVLDIDNHKTVGLYFKDGNGYLVSEDKILEKVVFSFKITGTGYYKTIHLFV